MELAMEWTFKTISGIWRWTSDAMVAIAASKMMIAINIITLIFTIVVICKIIRGRRRKLETQTNHTSNSTNAVSTVVHVNNSMQMRPDTSDNRRDQDHILTNAIKQPQEYNGRSNVHAWLAKLEIYLEAINKDKWAYVTISLLQDEYLKNINNLEAIRKDLNGYEQLKQIIIKKYNEKQNEQPINNMTNISKEDFFNKRQKQFESIRTYGDAFIKLAKEAFPKINLTTIDDFLKQSFQRGIIYPNLRLVALEKLNKMNAKQDKKDGSAFLCIFGTK
jgi:hypothetical protein